MWTSALTHTAFTTPFPAPTPVSECRRSPPTHTHRHVHVHTHRSHSTCLCIDTGMPVYTHGHVHTHICTCIPPSIQAHMHARLNNRKSRPKASSERTSCHRLQTAVSRLLRVPACLSCCHTPVPIRHTWPVCQHIPQHMLCSGGEGGNGHGGACVPRPCLTVSGVKGHH